MKKICFIATGGGHLEEIRHISNIVKSEESFLVTQDTKASRALNEKKYLLLENDKKNIVLFALKFFWIGIQSFKIFIKEKPDVIISTGAAMTVPMCYFGKIFKKKVIFIESFAKIKEPSKTGKLVYPIADLFVVQWEGLLKFYPKAVCWGWIY